MAQTENKWKTTRDPSTRSVGVQLLAPRLRLAILRLACRLLLPRDVWIGKHHGAYTQRWDICIGKLDNRGVLQGVLDRDVGA